MTILISLVIALVVALPRFIAGRLKSGSATFGITALFAMPFLYLSLPTSAGPLFGSIGLIAASGLMISGAISGLDSAVSVFETKKIAGYRKLFPVTIAAIVFVIYAGTAFWNSILLRAKDYAALVPPIQQRDWSRDFQPKDPRHFRVSSPENAHFLAGRAIGQATTLDSRGQPNSIGSQFTIYEDRSSIQIIGKELWTIVPLDWKSSLGWKSLGLQWSGTPGVPGYIKVSAENPIIPAEYVPLPAGKEFRYTPKAIFSKNLERLVWTYHKDKNIADIHLEIDDQGGPHYIISLSEPTIGWWGEKVTGALIIDPVTGDGVRDIIPLNKIPSWVDRVEAQEIVHRNIDYHGRYSKGYLNNSFYSRSILTATETHFGYGSDGQPVFATGITAESSDTKSHSLVAVYYTNTRTGETVEYLMHGGTTEEKAVEQCNMLGDIINKHYHGSTPQLYNIYGYISYVIPIQNDSHAFAGVAIVSIANPQIIAWGPNAYDAELAYKQVVIANSSQMAIDNTRKLSTVSGTVARTGQIIVSGSTTYFVLLKGMDHLLTVPPSASPKIVITQPGDIVTVEYFDSGESIMPINKFDNQSVKLARSDSQIDVQGRAAAAIDKARAKDDGRDKVQALLESLTPEQKQVLKSKLR